MKSENENNGNLSIEYLKGCRWFPGSNHHWQGGQGREAKNWQVCKKDLSPPNITSFSVILTLPLGSRTSIDLTQLTREKTHNLWLKLKDRVAGEFHLYFHFHHNFQLSFCSNDQMNLLSLFSDDYHPSPSLISSPLLQDKIHLLVRNIALGFLLKVELSN